MVYKIWDEAFAIIDDDCFLFIAIGDVSLLIA